eukprot:6409872-Pyramimonas_sp.AAC.1
MEGTATALSQAELLFPHCRPHVRAMDLGRAAANHAAGDIPTARDSHVPRGGLGDACEARR